jgi:hypothetical protein
MIISQRGGGGVIIWAFALKTLLQTSAYIESLQLFVLFMHIAWSPVHKQGNF